MQLDQQEPSCVIEEVHEESFSQQCREEASTLPGKTVHAEPESRESEASSSDAQAAVTKAAQPEGALTVEGSVPCEPSTEEQVLTQQAEACKAEGNSLYGQERYEEAAEQYWKAVDTSPDVAAKQRAVYFCNLAACYLKMQQPQQAAEQASNAIKLDPGYIKALMRRSLAFEQMDDVEHALADCHKVAELDPSNPWAAAAVRRLQPLVTERQEKMKEEMLGKLKDLGNNILGRFGLSLDNFKMEKDPATGGYSIQMQK